MDEVDACGNNEIIAAARDRDWNRVRELLKKGADVRNCNCFGQNALFFAVLNCRFELADELYQRGARLSGLIDNPDSEMLAGIADMLKKVLTWLLSLVLMLFTLYLSVAHVISGTADSGYGMLDPTRHRNKILTHRADGHVEVANVNPVRPYESLTGGVTTSANITVQKVWLAGAGTTAVK